MSSSNQYELNPPPSDAISSIRFAPNSSTKLLVSSWDKFLYLYEAGKASGLQLIQKFEHPAPLLDACFGEDENVAFSGGLDWDVRRLDLETGQQTVLSSHDAPIRALAYCRTRHMLISASWDQTLHIHHPQNRQDAPSTLSLPGKPFAISLSASKLVIAMASRLVHIHDLDALDLLSAQSAQPPPNSIEAEPYQKRESSLKFMTRALACMPNDAGYASSSIEGRVAVEWFDASSESQARKYAFKCHRQPDESGGQPVDVVYPVHALAFHPVHGTFVSGGGDGVVAVWDAVAKRRIRQYQRYPASIVAMDFSSDGNYLAVSVSPGFEEAQEDIDIGTVKVFVRELSENETKGRAK